MSFENRYPCVVYDRDEGCWLFFESPVETIVAHCPSETKAALNQVAQEAKKRGLWAVGWLSYEASFGFDPILVTKEEDDFPALWFGLFRAPERRQFLPCSEGAFEPPSWNATVSRELYRESIERIQSLIGRGDTYQVNYSFRLRAPISADPCGLFASMVAVQAGAYSAYIDAGRFVVCSASPELLFERRGHAVSCNPMKGTARRGRFLGEDAVRYQQLVESTKDQAENVMIVDMVRNDLARIAERGSVSASQCCEIERYPRVFQMTRRVNATATGALGEVMQALYPAASITGAPKGRTMEIIAELENTPRRIYTGSVGFIAPEGREVFNVAIRTALIDRERGQMEYGVGSGIVWDSVAENEYDECFAKASVVTARAETFDLFETILWEAAGGYFLLERHIARLKDSCRYFGWNFDEVRVRLKLHETVRIFEGAEQARRVRLCVDHRGGVRIEFSALQPLPTPYIVALAHHPVDSESYSLFHKTTNRSPYDIAEPVVPDVHDVILWNEKGEITESRIANIVFDFDGELVTPSVESGLLAGCYRAELLDNGTIRERCVLKEELSRARALYLINSLRRMWPVELAQS